MKVVLLFGVLALVRNVVSQLSQIESPSEHNLLYQVLVPKGQSRTLFYIHSKGFDNCTLKFEYYSISPGDEPDANENKMITQVEVFTVNKTKIHDSWFRNDDPKYGAQKHELKLSQEGLYQIRINNLDEVDFVTAFITGFYNCNRNKDTMKHSDMLLLQQKAESNINHLFMNLAKVMTEESLVDNRRKATKNTHTKLLYGCIGEIFAIILVAWWQIYYLVSMLEKKLVI